MPRGVGVQVNMQEQAYNDQGYDTNSVKEPSIEDVLGEGKFVEKTTVTAV
jgi:hypothetical protein